GDPAAGDPVAGNPVAGDPVAGNPVAGNPAASPLVRTAGNAASKLPPDLQGPYWLGQRLAEQVDRLRAALLETEVNWNIERRPRVLQKA
ncbi:hypothetical protein BZM26_06200, partial [Paraburkholderia strydomiana]